MKEKEEIIAELSPEEMAFLDKMLEQLRKEGYNCLSREELINIIVKATKESQVRIQDLIKSSS